MDELTARMLTFLHRPGGAVAQLGARLDGIEEVVGSNPIGSTTTHISHIPDFATPHTRSGRATLLILWPR
jgi:hypothetical protein